MIRSSVRFAGLAFLLSMNGCGDLASSGTGAGQPGLNVAEAALQGGAGQIALQVSEGVLRESPGNARAMEIKGDALALLGAYEQAAVVYQTLLAKNPGSNRAMIGLGRITLSKQPAVAEALFQQVLNRDPKDLTALNNLGIARDLQGHHAEAQTAYRQALAVNPELDSAQANLALSMAMTGQGPAAVQLLKTKATQPGVATKVKHDYAVVLALAGNRSEAEQVLREDLSPQEVRQFLEGVTGTPGRTARETLPEPTRVSVAARNWDEVPPDVVQVPDPWAHASPASRTAGNGAPATIVAVAGAAPLTAAMAATLGAPQPMVVRPQAASAPDTDSPLLQPVTPVAAAITNQHALALPIQHDAAGSGVRGGVLEATQAETTVVPAVVAMPAANPPGRPVARAAVTRDTIEPARAIPTEAPPVSRAVEPPSSGRSPDAAARIAPPEHRLADAMGAASAHAFAMTNAAGERTSEARTDSARPNDATAAGIRTDEGRSETKATIETAAQSAPSAHVPAPESQVPASPEPAFRVSARFTVTPAGDIPTAPPSRTARSDESTPTVQFAAAASEEAAHAFWRVLVQRFPDALGQREPVVVRFDHDGAVFWRVRAEGFANVAEAQTLCAHMRADGQPCFVPRS